jgi:hypothetical protein
MSVPRGSGPRFSLARWSRRKLEAAKPTPAAAPAAAAPAVASPAPAAADLPPVESLTLASDFTAFLRPEVDDQVRRAALKQLFRDPRFNIMDGLDTYIDDYTQADPIAPDVLADLLQRGFAASPEAGDPAVGGVSSTPGAASAADATPSALPEAHAGVLSSAQPAPAAPSTDVGAPAAQDTTAADVPPQGMKPAGRAP